MTPLRDYGWLMLGLLAALIVAASGDAIADALAGLAPLPWGRIAAGAGIFAAFAAAHFRSRLVRVSRALAHERERQQAASRLVAGAVDDGMRWLRVIQENLELVDSEATAAPESKLYLEGAQAHADKLEQAFERVAGNQRALARRSP